jgi:hypothetical protein
MLRTSNYTIYVDLPGNEEEMLLVHTYTGAFDRVSRRLAFTLAAGASFVCDTFTCGSYSGTCGAFACGSFKIKP